MHTLSKSKKVAARKADSTSVILPHLQSMKLIPNSLIKTHQENTVDEIRRNIA